MFFSFLSPRTLSEKRSILFLCFGKKVKGGVVEREGEEEIFLVQKMYHDDESGSV